MRRSIALFALLLPGCETTPGTTAGVVPASRASQLAGWRMVSLDEPGAKAKPQPAGFLEARSMAGSAGAFYLVYDAGYRAVGHVTSRGYGVKYAKSGRIQDKPMGEGPVLDQAGRILGVEGRLRIYGLDGKPRDLP